jgi:hypothetical protein
VFEVAMNVRRVLEYAWSDATAHHSVVPDPAKAPARGNCGVSSVYLARQLVWRGYDAQVADGVLGLDGLDEGFVWVHVNVGEDSAWVADVSCDQFKSINRSPVHVGEYDSGPGLIGAYAIQELFDPYANVHRKPMRRYAILEENIAALPRWRRRMLGLSKPSRR